MTSEHTLPANRAFEQTRVARCSARTIGKDAPRGRIFTLMHGGPWFEHATVAHLERIVREAHARGVQVEVVSLP